MSIDDVLRVGAGYTIPSSTVTGGYVVSGGGADILGAPMWAKAGDPKTGGPLAFLSETQSKAPVVEAREAVERQRKDEADRQERARDSWQALGSEVILNSRIVAEKVIDRGPDLLKAGAMFFVALGMFLGMGVVSVACALETLR